MKFAKHLSLGLGVSFLLTLAACQSDNKFEFDTFEYDLYVQQTDGNKEVIHVQGEGVLPTNIGGADLSVLRDSLLAMCNSAKGNGKEITYRLEQNERVIEKLRRDADKTSFFNTSLNVKLITDNVIVWENYSEEYSFGAAHGMYATQFLNYSLKQHKILSLKDIMKPGYEKELTDMLRDKLASNDDILNSPDEINIPKQFYISSNGLTFVYGVYEIAPFAAGEISVEFNALEIENLLSKEGLETINYFKND